MNHSTIVQRIILAVVMPVTILILLSGVLIWKSFHDYQNAVQAKSIMEIAVAAGDLIHPMQIERGMTAGFIQSNGQKFADTLPGVRAKTDEKLAAYKHRLEGMNTDSMPDLKKVIEEAHANLAGVAGTREKASQLSIAAPESTKYFSGAINLLLEVMSTAAEYNSDPAITKKLLIYHAFESAKENAGQERALAVAVFVNNRVEHAQYRAILGRIFKQEAYLDLFIDSATPQEKKALKSALNSDAAKDVQRMRDIMAERALEGGFDIDPSLWFARITSKIDGLYEVEQLLTKNINDDTEALLATTFAEVPRSAVTASAA